ncbi:MAG TPA: amidohydrolase family protein [Steroidobacteraceae bacterium]|jgi:imidazolonepropionase-like amidohydrolase|nr:amidohydrolase family protein [Steroidobacteraceae bacterium]
MESQQATGCSLGSIARKLFVLSGEMLKMTIRTRTVFLCLTLVGLMLPIAGPAAPRQDPSALPPAITAYVGATLIDGTGAAPLADSVIVVRGDRITALGRSSEIKVPDGASKVSLSGRYVIPGLINTHVHLASPPLPEVAKAYLRRELYSGVTAVRDMAGDARLLGELKREALRDEIASPDIYYSALVAGPGFFSDPRVAVSLRGWKPGTAPWMHSVDENTDLPQLIAEAKGTGATGIKIYADLSEALIREVTAEAHRQGMKVWAHAFVPPTLPSEVAKSGVDSMSHADLVAYELADPVPRSYKELSPIDPAAAQPSPRIDRVLELMARNHIILDATVNVSYLYPSNKLFPQGVASAIAGEAFRHGVLLSTGTDDDPDFHVADSRLLAEIERLVQESRLSPMDVIRAATANGASVLGIGDQVGTLAGGKTANFVILKRDPLTDIRNLRSVEIVVKHGKRYPRSKYVPASPALVPSDAN